MANATKRKLGLGAALTIISMVAGAVGGTVAVVRSVDVRIRDNTEAAKDAADTASENRSDIRVMRSEIKQIGLDVRDQVAAATKDSTRAIREAFKDCADGHRPIWEAIEKAREQADIAVRTEQTRSAEEFKALNTRVGELKGAIDAINHKLDKQ